MIIDNEYILKTVSIIHNEDKYTTIQLGFWIDYYLASVLIVNNSLRF